MKPRTQKSPGSVVREIKRNTRRKITAEEKIRNYLAEGSTVYSVTY